MKLACNKAPMGSVAHKFKNMGQSRYATRAARVRRGAPFPLFALTETFLLVTRASVGKLFPIEDLLHPKTINSPQRLHVTRLLRGRRKLPTTQKR